MHTCSSYIKLVTVHSVHSSYHIYYAAPLLSCVKYGASRKQKELWQGFSGLFSGTVSLKNFVKVPDGQVFALIQKVPLFEPQGRVWHLSVLILAKFCTSWHLRSSEPETYPENNSPKIPTPEFFISHFHREFFIFPYRQSSPHML